MKSRFILLLLLLMASAFSNAEDSANPIQLETGFILKYYAGLFIQDLSEELMKIEPAFAAGGALVNSVRPSSPSERAGLLRGDIVTAVNNIPVKSSRDFVVQLIK